ncbi:helix-turn-helix domain-containing protein [Achromobacter mucicolens]|jgi:transcriptional regulator with XRE-family HTH domain|uniref:helix-turn-helix domain-containing protein n=1 Tax=Achromobacter mucicolens TaxID=1389922 RepID=UPI003C6C503C
MSPFAIYLRALRLSRGLKQQDVARLLGYEPSYLSALERSAKGPPRQAFVARLVRVLRLSPVEQAELNEALHRSRRQVCLPWTASLEEYELMRELEPQLGRLNSAQIALIRHVLALHTCPRIQTPEGLDEACTPSCREKAMT